MTARSSLERPLPATCVFYAPSPRLRVSLTALVWRLLQASSAYVQIWRHPQNRKYVTYHYGAREGRATAIVNMHKNLVKIGRVVPKIWSQTDKHRHRHRHRHIDKHAHHNTPLPYGGRSDHFGDKIGGRPQGFSSLGSRRQCVTSGVTVADQFCSRAGV